MGEQPRVGLDGDVNDCQTWEKRVGEKVTFRKHLTDKILENLFANIAAQLRAFEIVRRSFIERRLRKNTGLFFSHRR